MAKVVFYGSSPLSNIVLQILIDNNAVASVVTKEDKPMGRHMELAPNPVKVLAEKYGISVFTTPQPGEIALVAAYGKIIPQQTLNTYNGQIYNIHPSLLPKYRGASPLQQQILDGITETGVTIIQLDAEMDHGPIVAQEKDKIMAEDTWLTLGERLFTKGANLFLNSPLSHLFIKERGAADGGVSYVPQVHELATYTKKITRQDGFVSWEEFKPEQLATKLRAYSNWPGIWTLMPDGKRLKLLSVNPTAVQIEGKTPQSWPI